MKASRHDCNVINDDDCHTHVNRKILQELDVGVEATGRTTDANNGEISCR